MIAEKDNLCYNIPASRMTLAAERIARRDFTRSPDREKKFFTPNARNPLKKLDSKK
jgi:hypothetical protein